MVGLVHAINENLLLGLIPTETIMKFVISIFGGFCGISSEEYAEAQKKTAEILTAAGLDADSTADLAEYNGQEGVLKKAWNWITGKKTITYKNNTNTNIWLPSTIIFSNLICWRYFFLSSLIYAQLLPKSIEVLTKIRCFSTI